MRHQYDCISAPVRDRGLAAARIAGKTLILLFLLHILLLTGPASAGTETGEFCPTCPDWTNLDGWLEQKAAYEEGMENGQQNRQQNELNHLQAKSNNRGLEIKTAKTAAEPNAALNSSASNSPIASGNDSSDWSAIENGEEAGINSINVINSTNVINSANSIMGATSKTSGTAAIAPLGSISPDEVILDISPSAATYIEGAVNIDYESFFDKGRIKPAQEIAAILGDAGISSNDSLVITGECMPCGGGPAPAFFTYWMLKYLGHEKVRVLEGSSDDWKAAGLNTSNTSAIRAETDYIALLQPELFATYEFVSAGGVQIVDARPARDYEIGAIPGAINIPYENVLVNGSIIAQEQMEEVFHSLDKTRPVVAYTNIGVEASLIWFALNASGYDARLYSWRDWLENQPEFRYELAEIEARPNPVRSGETTTIAVSFRERRVVTNESRMNESEPVENSSSDGEAKLTIKGCATCGFGSPQGFANLDRKDGYVQIGSSGKAAEPSASATSASPLDSTSGAYASSAGNENGSLKCSAVIEGPDGAEAARTSLLYTSGNKYAGIWNADVAPGIYSVSIVATLSGNAETFPDVLELEVTGRA